MVGNRIVWSLLVGSTALGVGPLALAASGSGIASFDPASVNGAAPGSFSPATLEAAFQLVLPTAMTVSAVPMARGPYAHGDSSKAMDTLCEEWDHYFTLTAIRQLVEFDTIAIDLPSPSNSDSDLKDVKLYRGGATAHVGLECFGVDVSVYKDELVIEPTTTQRTQFSGYGLNVGRLGESDTRFGFGVSGTPRWALNDCWSLFAEYELAMSVGDLKEIKLKLNEERVRLGIGADYAGIQLAIGAVGDFVQGRFEIDPTVDLTGENIGGYVRLGYHPRALPIVVSGTHFIGQYSGWELRLGIAF